MGGAVSNPVDESTKNEIQQLIKDMLTVFTKEYVKHYAIALIKKCIADAAAEPENWKLSTRPEDKSDIKFGALTKEGGIRKSWKKRFFVVRYDHSIEYFEKEDEIKKPKPKVKGNIGLCGYTVNADPNNTLLARAQKLAEKMGVDLSQIPKPKEYPPFTIELHHWRRRTYYIKADNETQFKEWVDAFQNSCRLSWGYRNHDPVHIHAFKKALELTRWSLGRWGWWSWGGSEEQVLSDLISDQLDFAVMGRIYSKITGPWVVRNTIRNQVLKTLDTIISAAVTPAWKAMEAAVSAVRPKIEPTIKEMVDPVGKLEKELTDKLRDAAMSILTPLLEEHVKPHLKKIVEVIKSPMVDAYTEAGTLVDEKLTAFSAKGTAEELKKSFRDLDSVPRSWDIYRATGKLDVMYDPLWALNVVFPDIWPWSLIWHGHDHIRRRTDNAVYTFQERVLKALEDNANAAAEEGGAKALYAQVKDTIMADFREDSSKATVKYYSELLMMVILPPFQKVANPACDAVINPISDLIPEPMKQFVDPNQLFADLIVSILQECVNVVLRD